MVARPTDAPAVIEQLAERCLVHVKNRFGFELDFTPDTLGVVDHFLEEVVIEEAGGNRPPSAHRRRSHLIHLLAPTVGAYFGEVMRGYRKCRWRIPSEDPREWLLEFEQFFLRFNPAGAAAEALFQAPVEEWSGSLVAAPGQVVALHERLAAAPPLPEDQFFSLATRFEVLQIVDDWLRQQSAAEDGPLCCTEADYDAVFGAP
jgi:hypothetical protein